MTERVKKGLTEKVTEGREKKGYRKEGREKGGEASSYHPSRKMLIGRHYLFVCGREEKERERRIWREMMGWMGRSSWQGGSNAVNGKTSRMAGVM